LIRCSLVFCNSRFLTRHFLDRSLDLADKTQAAQAKIEDEKRIYCKENPVLDYTTATQDANTSGQRPSDQDKIDWDTCDPVETQGRHHGSKNQREKSVANNTDALSK
jgi:hypothetical protein